MGFQSCSPFLFLLALASLQTPAFVQAQNPWCFDDAGNYTANTTYQSNLLSILSSLPSSMNDSAFHSASIGAAPDEVYATALCRADLQLEVCRSCIRTAAAQIVDYCPSRRHALLWRDTCTLRYSNASFFGVLSGNYIVNVFATANVTSAPQFIADLRPLLDNLTSRAADGVPLLKAAADNVFGPDLYRIYSMVQCSPDLSADDCRQCLFGIAPQISQCCNGVKTSLQILHPSCTLWYSVSSFYNLTRLQEVQALLAPLPPSLTPPLGSSPPPQPPPDRHAIIIIGVVVAVAAMAALIGGAILLRRKMKKKHPPDSAIAEEEDEISTEESLQYNFDVIRAATDDFSEANKLGRGGFGAVYKGKLESGREIAAKRLSQGSSQGDLEFKNEVTLVAKLQHRNLVKLYGFAMQGTERVLVYEFVKNGSLDAFIFDPVKRSEINWDARFRIIKAIAKGILYLHEDSRFRIIHRDLKPSNILLDGQMNPKIADFGLAKLFEETAGDTSRIVGTQGYMPPEYMYHGQISVKIDVFSFGVIVLEILTGQKNNLFMIEGLREHMLGFAWKSWREGSADFIIDPVLRADSRSLRDMLRCIHIGLLCVQDGPADRPTMASVVLMLNSSSITIPLPRRPAFYASDVSDSSEVGLIAVRDSPSKNEVSVTDLYPR